MPDERFGGGGQAMIDAFLEGTRAVGRKPQTLSAGYMPGLDGLNQALAGARFARTARDAASLWVVAAAASYGAAAPNARRPYACWIATSLADEWRTRVGALTPARRVAHAVNAPLLLRLERRVLAQASAVFGISPSSAAALARAGGRNDVGILPIPVDVEHFRPEPDEQWLARLSRPTLIFVGRGDDPRKNTGLLLDAWPAIAAAHPAARLVLVGRRPTGSPPAGVEARGEVADVAAELQSATLFLLPSLQEGFAIVAAEALACGVPVVSTPSGGPERLLRESGGGHVLSGFSPEELAGHVSELLGQTEALEQMRRAGRSYVEREHAPAMFWSRLGAALEGADNAT